MSRSIKVYIFLFVLSLVFAYYASLTKEDQNKGVEFFNLGKNKIVSLVLESNSKELRIEKANLNQSNKSKKVLFQSSNQSSFMVFYKDKTIKDDKTESQTQVSDSITMRGGYAVNRYLDNYTPLYAVRIIESQDLSSFGLSESSDKIVIKTSDQTKTLWVGDLRHNSYHRYYYDIDSKRIFLGADELYTSLINADTKLISYDLSDIKGEDISSLEFIDISKGSEPKKIYKVLTNNHSLAWAASKTDQGDPKLSRFVQFIMEIPVSGTVDLKLDSKLIYEIRLIQDDKVVEIIKIAKDNDMFYGQSNYTGSWVSLDTRSVEFLTDIVADI